MARRPAVPCRYLMGDFELRPYQRRAIEKLHHAYNFEDRSRMIFEFATGLGKTQTAQEVIADFIGREDNGQRAAFVAPLIDLAQQPRATFERLFRPDQIGLVQGENNEVGRKVTFASLATLDSSKRMQQLLEAQQGAQMDVLVIDECHLHPLQQQRVIERLLAPWGLLLGLTATVQGDFNLREIYRDDIVETADFYAAVLAGYLCDHQYLYEPTDFDARTISDSDLDLLDLDEEELKGAKRKKFSEEVLQRLKQSNRYQRAFEIWCDPDKINCRPTAIYAQGIADAFGFRDYFRAQGCDSEVVTAKTHPDQRKDLYTALGEGKIDILVSVGTMIHGVDIPALSACIIARRMNQRTFTQAVGRVLRIHESKWCVTTQNYQAIVVNLAEKATDNDYTLMTYGSLLGLETNASVKSVKRLLQDKLEESTGSPMQASTPRDWGELVYERAEQVQAGARDLFTGTGWTRLPGSQRFFKEVPGIGSITATPTLAGQYLVTFKSPEGRERQVTPLALPARDALVKGQQELERQKVKAQATHDPVFASTQTLTFQQWKHMAMQRIGGVERPATNNVRSWTTEEQNRCFAATKSKGLNQAHYYAAADHLAKNKSNFGEGGRMFFDSKTGEMKTHPIPPRPAGKRRVANGPARVKKGKEDVS